MRSARTRVALLLVGVAVAGALSALAAGIPQKAEPQRMILVAGNDPWTETDIEIGPRDRVTFKAGGKVCFSGTAPQACQGPAGWGRSDYANSWPGDYHQCEDPMSDANHASLIASVDGGTLYIGPGKTITGKEGNLKLGINDCTFEGDYGNSGSFTVTVSIVRGGTPR